MMPTVWIKKTVVDFIFENGNQNLPLETGGILLGYSVSNFEQVILDIIGPGNHAVHGPTFFEPDQEFHKREIARIYSQSGRLITYLGDWHTHPNSYAYLSAADRRTIRTISTFEEARLKNPLMLVAAPPQPEFKIWRYARPKHELCNYIIFD